MPIVDIDFDDLEVTASSEARDVIFRDDYTGTDTHPPHRGKWIKFYSKTGAPIINDRKCEIISNQLHLLIDPTVVDGSTATVSCITRAEFKPPFKIRYKVRIDHEDFRGSLSTSDMRDGYLPNCFIYGKQLVYYGAYEDGDFILNVIKDGGLVSYDSDPTHAEDAIWYIVTVEITDNLDAYLNIDLTITLDDETPVWSQSALFDKPTARDNYLRFRHYTTNDDHLSEATFDDFVVFGQKTRKPVARVTIKDTGYTDVITEDVVSFKVGQREGSPPHASVVLRNQGNRYSRAYTKGEIEISGGYDGLMWLLFRGYVEAPRRSFPPSLLTFDSAKGYSKRLDFRETDGESWPATSIGDIVRDIVDTYFSGVFSYDHVSEGSTIDLDSDDESCGDLIRKLQDINGYVFWVDLNMDIHFCDPAAENSQSNLTIREARDVLQIEVASNDEIVNKVTVKGTGDPAPTGTDEDIGSQTDYWLRERTFSEDDLKSDVACAAKAAALIAKLHDLEEEIPLKLPEFFCVELYDDLIVDCAEVGLSSASRNVRGVDYSYDSGGLQTSLSLNSKGFKLSDTMGKYERKVTNITNSVTNVINNPGATLYDGEGAPGAGLGIDGDYYLDTDTNDLYEKEGGAWGVIATLGGGGSMAGYIPLGTDTDKASAVTTAAYAAVVTITPTNAKQLILAKIVVTTTTPCYVQYFWNAAAVGEERYVTEGIIEHFHYGQFGMVGDGAKAFVVKAKYVTTAGTVYVEVNSEEATP